ncbi:MAG TPA: hypothetical protein VF755_05275 [Catenuloplanes sp.]
MPARAAALRDPSLVLVYWPPQFETWADRNGEPVDLPADATPTTIGHDGQRVAALLDDLALADEPELLAAVSAVAAITLRRGCGRERRRAAPGDPGGPARRGGRQARPAGHRQ